MSTETARLFLKTYPFTNGLDNSYGFSAYNNTLFTWKNINLRTVLGHEMYEKYDTFNLSLMSVVNSGRAVIYANSQDDCLVNLIISGLPLINSTYNHSTKANTNKCQLCVYEFPPVTQYALTSHIQYSDGVASTNFSKSSDVIDLTIEYVLMETGVAVTALSIYPEMSFYFNITGVKLSNYANSNHVTLQLSK